MWGPLQPFERIQLFPLSLVALFIFEHCFCYVFRVGFVCANSWLRLCKMPKMVVYYPLLKPQIVPLGEGVPEGLVFCFGSKKAGSNLQAKFHARVP
jgi:hypothetical protein